MALDVKDKKILQELDFNARQTLSQLSKKVKLSRDIVNYRINKLEKEGYIKGYQTIVNFSKLGYLTIRFHLKFIDISPKIEKNLIAFLLKKENILLVSRTKGDFDLSFVIQIKDLFELNNFEIEFNSLFNKYIKSRELGIYLEIYHFQRSYLLNEKNKINNQKIIKLEKDTNKIDQNDLKILKILSKNARTPLVKISNKLNMNASTVANKIKKLEKDKIILGYKLLFGFDKINFSYFKIDFILRDISLRENLINYCKNNPYIIYAGWVSGGVDLEIYLEIENAQKLLELIEKMRNLFPGIREWGYTSFETYDKFNYL